MKTILTLIIFSFLMAFNVKAQELRKPLAPKVANEVISASPGEEWTWVKGHWTWDGGKYIWKRGMYVQKRKGFIWMDGEWERNQRSGWWKYNEGYWQKDSEASSVKNDNNTKEEDKASKDKRKSNKAGGLYIKTGSSK